jgi:hypothetical protein
MLAQTAKKLLSTLKAQTSEEATLITPNSQGLTVLHLALQGSCLPEAQQAALDIVALLAEKDTPKLSLKVADKVQGRLPIEPEGNAD